MGDISYPLTLTHGQIPTAAQWNSLFTAVTDQVNGNLADGNIQSAANIDPSKVGDYSADATEAATSTDPGATSSESLATTLEGELARIRYQLHTLINGRKSGTYWGDAPLGNMDDVFPRGAIGGLGTSQDTDSDHDILIAVGSCKATSGDYDIHFDTALTKQIDANWAAGDDAGGFPSALTIANATWYHIFVIADASDGTVDAGFDTSLTATNLLSDASYTTPKYRRIGSVLTDGSANITDYTQVGDEFWWDTPVMDVVDASVGGTQISAVLTVPTGLEVMAHAHVSYAVSSGTSRLNIGFGGSTVTEPSASDYDFQASGRGGFGPGGILTNTSGEIEYHAENGTNDEAAIRTHGWRDFLGRWD